MNPRYICSKARIISPAHHAEHLASALRSSSLPPSCACVCIYLRRTRAGRAIKGTVNDDAARERAPRSLALALSPAVSVGRRAAAVILNANNLQSAHTTLSSVVLFLLERASEANRRWEMLQSTVSRSSPPSVRWAWGGGFLCKCALQPAKSLLFLR